MRLHFALLLATTVAVPTAGAAFLIAKPQPGQVCLAADNAGYRLSDRPGADYIVRVDNADAAPDVRMQIINDPAAADFVLIDDEAGNACDSTRAIKSVRRDASAERPDLTVTLSREAAPIKIYVRSAQVSIDDAAALFAVMWKDAHANGLIRQKFASQH